MVDNKILSVTAAKKVFANMFECDTSPKQITDELGLAQVSDEGAMKELADSVIAQNPQSLEDYKNGKTRALGFLVGMAMKQSKGKGNPQILNKLLTERLEEYKANN